MWSCDGPDRAPAQEPKLFHPKDFIKNRTRPELNLNAVLNSVPSTRTTLPVATEPRRRNRPPPVSSYPSAFLPPRDRRERKARPFAQQPINYATTLSDSNVATASFSSTTSPPCLPAMQHNNMPVATTPRHTTQPLAAPPVAEAVDDEFGNDVPEIDQADIDRFDALNPESKQSSTMNTIAPRPTSFEWEWERFQRTKNGEERGDPDDDPDDLYSAQEQKPSSSKSGDAQPGKVFSLSGDDLQVCGSNNASGSSSTHADVQTHDPVTGLDEFGWSEKDSQDLEAEFGIALGEGDEEAKKLGDSSPAQDCDMRTEQATTMLPVSHEPNTAVLSLTNGRSGMVESEHCINPSLPADITSESVDIVMGNEQTEVIPHDENSSVQHEIQQLGSQMIEPNVASGDQQQSLASPNAPTKKSSVKLAGNILRRRRDRDLKNAKIDYHKIVSRLWIKRGSEIKTLKAQLQSSAQYHQAENSREQAEIRDQLDAANSTITKLKGEKESMVRQSLVDTIEKDLQTKIGQLNKQLETEKSRVGDLEQENKALKAEMADMEKAANAEATKPKEVVHNEVKELEMEVESLKDQLKQKKDEIQLLRDEGRGRPCFGSFKESLEEVQNTLQRLQGSLGKDTTVPNMQSVSSTRTDDWEFFFSRVIEHVYSNAYSAFTEGPQSYEPVDLQHRLIELRSWEFTTKQVARSSSVVAGKLRQDNEALKILIEAYEKAKQTVGQTIEHLGSLTAKQSNQIAKLTKRIIDSEDYAKAEQLKKKVEALESEKSKFEQQYLQSFIRLNAVERAIGIGIFRTGMEDTYSQYEHRRDFIPEFVELICKLRAELGLNEKGMPKKTNLPRGISQNTSSAATAVPPVEAPPFTPTPMSQRNANSRMRRNNRRILKPVKVPVVGAVTTQSLELSPGSKRKGAENTPESPTTKKNKTNDFELGRIDFAEPTSAIMPGTFEPPTTQPKFVVVDSEGSEPFNQNASGNSADLSNMTGIESEASGPSTSQQGAESLQAQEAPRTRSSVASTLLNKMRGKSTSESGAREPARQRPLSGLERWRLSRKAKDSQSEEPVQTRPLVATVETKSPEPQEEVQRPRRSHHPVRSEGASQMKSAMRAAGASSKGPQKVQFEERPYVQVYTPEPRSPGHRQRYNPASSNRQYRRNHEQLLTRQAAGLPEYQGIHKTVFQPRRTAEAFKEDRIKLAHLAAKNVRLQELANYKPPSARTSFPPKRTPGAIPQQAAPPSVSREYVIDEPEDLFPSTPGSFPQEQPDVPWMSGALSVGWNDVNNRELAKVFEYHSDSDGELTPEEIEREAQAERTRDVVRRLFTPFRWATRGLVGRMMNSE